jgi:hypothetical protein
VLIARKFLAKSPHLSPALIGDGQALSYIVPEKLSLSQPNLMVLVKLFENVG